MGLLRAFAEQTLILRSLSHFMEEGFSVVLGVRAAPLEFFLENSNGIAKNSNATPSAAACQ